MCVADAAAAGAVMNSATRTTTTPWLCISAMFLKMPMSVVAERQKAFMKAMTSTMPGTTGGAVGHGGATRPDAGGEGDEDLDEIKRQLAELQSKLSKMNK